MKSMKLFISLIVAMAFCSTTAYASHHPRSSNASHHSRLSNALRNSKSSNKNQKTVTEKTLFVGPQQVDCQGMFPQKCYLVKESPEEPWTYFYQQIEGFNWENGNQYELRVRVIPIENPPADSSSIEYELIKIVNKKAVN